ncbi:PREDICTED: uncharacterized protein LOC108661390 [Theobroma cacao]|uniref:Uncharacterized protein LOC108661390 n=1 Tax=Theobroma cacao TaxID=3641 RepID=A0AB32W2C5_THECC|nr:PREDICTED: uncharacterized protein LOC108661390 [Theobroma cacao]
MPLSIYNKLGLGEIKPTTITLQLVDRSLTYLRGIVEDVLVELDKFIFPIDFIVFDMEKGREVLIIPGRPFLRITRAFIDVEKGELTLRVQDQEVTFNIFHALKFTKDHDECFVGSEVDRVTREVFIEAHPNDPLEVSFISKAEPINHEIVECVNALNARSRVLGARFELLDLTSLSCSPVKPSIEVHLKLELKPLLKHLRYAYLRDSSTLPGKKVAVSFERAQKGIGEVHSRYQGDKPFHMHAQNFDGG